jgi:hypothetical protein
MDKFELKEILQNNVETVVFTKVDGEKREMDCTLIAEYIPTPVVEKQQLLTENLTRKENPNTLAVWDIEKSQWRSFRVDSIESINVKV